MAKGKKNSQLIKLMIGIAIILTAIIFGTYQTSKIIAAASTSNVSSQNYFLQFLANMFGIHNQGSSSSSNGSYKGNYLSNQNNPNAWETGGVNAGNQQNPNSMTGANSSASQGGSNGATGGNNPGENAGGSSNGNDGTNVDQGTGNPPDNNSGNNPDNNTGTNADQGTGNVSGDNSADNSGSNSDDNTGTNSDQGTGNPPDNSSNNNPTSNSSDNNSGSGSGGSSGGGSGGGSGGNSGSNPGNSEICIPGCYPGCIPGCDPECVPPTCLLGNVNPANLSTINTLPTDTQVSQNIDQQNNQNDALAALLATNIALAAEVRESAEASKYQTVNAENIAPANTTPAPDDVVAKIKSAALIQH